MMSSWITVILLFVLFLDTVTGFKCFHSKTGGITQCSSEYPLCGTDDGFRACVGECDAELLKTFCHGTEKCCCAADYCNTPIPDKISCFHSETEKIVDCSAEFIRCGVKDGFRACLGHCDAVFKKDKCDGPENCCCATDDCNRPEALTNQTTCFHSQAGRSINCFRGFDGCGVKDGERACVQQCSAATKKDNCHGDEDCCCVSNNCNSPNF